jgi:hypothetical protein
MVAGPFYHIRKKPPFAAGLQGFSTVFKFLPRHQSYILFNFKFRATFVPRQIVYS